MISNKVEVGSWEKGREGGERRERGKERGREGKRQGGSRYCFILLLRRFYLEGRGTKAV